MIDKNLENVNKEEADDFGSRIGESVGNLSKSMSISISNIQSSSVPKSFLNKSFGSFNPNKAKDAVLNVNAARRIDELTSDSNLHARFWHNNTFNVVIDGIELITSEVDQSPTPTNNSVRLINSDWNLSANNGSSELDTQIPANAFQNKSKVKIKIDLRGKSFGSGIDEASIIFIQNGDWYAVNITEYVENGKNGSQEITIPLDRFKKINDSSQLDLSKTISNLHTRFWSDSSFDIEISVIDLE
jgi:hypothetical protein